MKGYEDIVATLSFLVVVLTGGYFYLNSEAMQQKKAQVVKEKIVQRNVQRSEPTMFEVAVKTTE